MAHNTIELQRLQHMELLLLWEGHLGNARLRELFGISASRASEWLKEFRDLQPRWTTWNTVTRRLDATAEFYRRRGRATAETLGQYLALVGLPAATGANPHDVVLSAFPDISAPNPRVFAELADAARLGRPVEITYRSMRDPTPHQRVISPHSIVHAGRRWHVRAFCELNEDFRDYAIGRISKAAVINQAAGHRMDDDTDWLTKVPVRLVAHPELTPEQQLLIRAEYFDDTAARVTTCRGPLVPYFIQDVRAAVDVTSQRPPDYQLAVENLEEVKPWLFPG